MINAKNLVDTIIQYETEGLDDNKTLELFSYLGKSKQVHHLQGHYGRAFNSLVESGFLDSRGNILKRCANVSV